MKIISPQFRVELSLQDKMTTKLASDTIRILRESEPHTKAHTQVV